MPLIHALLAMSQPTSDSSFDLKLLLFAFLAVAAGMSIRSIRIVKAGQAEVVQRMGRYRKTLEPGLHVITPFIDSITATLDMRERVVTLPPIECRPSEASTITATVRFSYRITDPRKATFEVTQLEPALRQLICSTITSRVAELSLDELLTSRAALAGTVQSVLDEASDLWGFTASGCEVTSIERAPQPR